MMQQTKRRPGAGVPPVPHLTLNELVAALAAIDFRTTPAEPVRALLGATQIDAVSIAPFVYFEAGRYTRNGVYRSKNFELILMCWSPGVISAIHSHGVSRGFVKVCRGALSVVHYTLVEGGREAGPARLTPAPAVTLNAGEIEVVASGADVHTVGPVRDSAISLHLYAQPLDEYLVYDIVNGSCRSVLSHYDIPPHR